MRRTPAPTSTVTRFPRRPRHALMMTAFAALALAACGTEKTSAGGLQSEPADTAEARPSLTEILDRVEQSCPPSAPPEPPPSGPALPLPPGAVETPPDVEPIAPTAGPEVELNARDWCASNLHEERIAQALWDLVDPTPAKVRTILNDLGYVDERIHDLKQSGATTRFFLDLRDKGGRLCLEGSAAGEETVVDKCVAPVSGPFTSGKRNQ
ncbi:hypothetical protein OG883_42415 [Streptomyces sp. NBC_01142]|uniref:hypothetical protein n=1 Tax=Streptomyces sp. NBC_01142 TaxID=2975865 RepID=UPI002253F27D|nr:hypothetical protein [Streptomyces sp. NBC_01142]MCX4826301.1 hypothetical protein [Streptomyces sp. NBC_01142]